MNFGDLENVLRPGSGALHVSRPARGPMCERTPGWDEGTLSIGSIDVFNARGAALPPPEPTTAAGGKGHGAGGHSGSRMNWTRAAVPCAAGDGARAANERPGVQHAVR